MLADSRQTALRRCTLLDFAATCYPSPSLSTRSPDYGRPSTARLASWMRSLITGVGHRCQDNRDIHNRYPCHFDTLSETFDAPDLQHSYRWHASADTAFARYYLHIGWNYPAAPYGFVDIMEVPDSMEHCVHLRHVDVEELNNELDGLLVELGVQIRVLFIMDKLLSTYAPWCEVYSACTNLEAAHLRLYRGVEVIDALYSMHTKLVSSKIYCLRNLTSTGDQFFLSCRLARC